MKSENTTLYDSFTGTSDLDEFREMVAKNAYYRAEKRGFKDGFDLEDWFEAEREISEQRRYWRR
ncbi:MAG: DUF2934 domain-containing protein [Methylococcales bacterium]|nr:DUF2934 domain-containing protein [Methylococcales bacterium]